MGLDQHAQLRNSKIDWEDYYMNNNSKDQKVFVWRKHARLQQFMAKKWAEQNPAVEPEGMLAHLGFNADQEAPCYMTKEVVKEREKWLEHMERSSPGGEHKFVAGKQGSSQAGPVT